MAYAPLPEHDLQRPLSRLQFHFGGDFRDFLREVLFKKTPAIDTHGTRLLGGQEEFVSPELFNFQVTQEAQSEWRIGSVHQVQREILDIRNIVAEAAVLLIIVGLDEVPAVQFAGKPICVSVSHREFQRFFVGPLFLVSEGYLNLVNAAVGRRSADLAGPTIERQAHRQFSFADSKGRFPVAGIELDLLPVVSAHDGRIQLLGHYHGRFRHKTIDPIKPFIDLRPAGIPILYRDLKLTGAL